MQVASSIQRAIVKELRASGCVFAEDEAQWLVSSSDTMGDLTHRVAQRVAGVPLEYVLGWTEFYGLRIVLEPGVFVPRRRTEFLVRQALSLARTGYVVVDLCCGSGAVGAALIANQGDCILYAVDVDPAAVRCARENIGDQGEVREGDLFKPLPPDLRGRVNLVVANAPYVPTDAIDTMPQEARLYEHHVALDGGVDGLDIQRRIAAHAPVWLANGGHLLMETSRSQAERSAEICLEQGLMPWIMTSDDLDATVIVACKDTVGD